MVALNTFLHKLFVFAGTRYEPESAQSQDLFNYSSQEYLKSLGREIIDYTVENLKRHSQKHPNVVHFVGAASGYVAGMDTSTACI